jgi:hypothetical protein
VEASKANSSVVSNSDNGFIELKHDFALELTRLGLVVVDSPTLLDVATAFSAAVDRHVAKLSFGLQY